MAILDGTTVQSRSGTDPLWEDRWKRNWGEEQSDKGRSEWKHWHMEMEERKKEGGKAEGMRVTHSDRASESEMGGRWIREWGEQGMLRIHLFDLADNPQFPLVPVCYSAHTLVYVCMWDTEQVILIPTGSKLCFICQVGSEQLEHTQTTRDSMLKYLIFLISAAINKPVTKTFCFNDKGAKLFIEGLISTNSTFDRLIKENE